MNTEKSVNKVALSGLIRDARLNTTSTGKQVCNFTLVICETNSKTFLPVTAWQGLGTRASELPPDSKVRVTGKLQVRSWEDKATASKRYKTEIVCDSLEPVTRLDLPPNQDAINKRPISDEDIPF